MSSGAYFLFSSCFCFSGLSLRLPCLGLRVTASATVLPRSPSALPWPQGDCLCLGLSSISICLAWPGGDCLCLGLALISICLAWPRGDGLSLALISIYLASASGWQPRPCLDLHLPCLGLGVAASALVSPRLIPSFHCLGKCFDYITLCSTSFIVQCA